MSSWDDAATATYYEAFCRRHPRYRRANVALIAQAGIEPGMRVLDFAAGTGRTAEAALRQLGPRDSVVCVEPAEAMRAAGRRRLTDSRVSWIERLPEEPEAFDRILCSAAIWQADSILTTLQTLARLLRSRGALCFNIPAAYLMEPDEPGGGEDPTLLCLLAALATSQAHSAATPAPTPAPCALGMSVLAKWLSLAGLHFRSWSFRVRITQDALGAWLKIPVLTDRLFGDLSPQERAQRIEAALETVDRKSWKWEHWRGWTAWKA